MDARVSIFLFLAMAAGCGCAAPNADTSKALMLNEVDLIRSISVKPNGSVLIRSHGIPIRLNGEPQGNSHSEVELQPNQSAHFETPANPAMHVAVPGHATSVDITYLGTRDNRILLCRKSKGRESEVLSVPSYDSTNRK
jgi:hypothetical protein